MLVVAGCAGPLYRACDRHRVAVSAPVFVVDQELADVLAVGRVEAGIAAIDGAPFVTVELTNQDIEPVRVVADCRWSDGHGGPRGSSPRWSGVLLPEATLALRFASPSAAASTPAVVFGWGR